MQILYNNKRIKMCTIQMENINIETYDMPY